MRSTTQQRRHIGAPVGHARQCPETGAPILSAGTGSVPEVAALLEHLAALGSTRPRLAPVLALGLFERVGSNWLSDELRTLMPQHNEPFRQQLSREHPLSPSDRVPPHLHNSCLGGLGLHHLVCAFADFYGPSRHLVKETNLFFALDAFLELLPYSPSVLLTRSPIGIASSFTRGNLWERWHYGERYAQVRSTARSPRNHAVFSGLLPADEPGWRTALGRLIAVNALLVARAFEGSERAHLVVSYEEHVERPVETRQAVADFLELPLVSCPQPRTPAGAKRGGPNDSTFATTGSKDRLRAELSAGEAEVVEAAVDVTLTRAETTLPASVVDAARGWLSGGERYELEHSPTRRDKVVRRPPAGPSVPPVAYTRGPGLRWRNLLVTNAEFAELLTLLHAGGAPNRHFGTHLLTCPMPHERGGRLHLSKATGRWTVSRGYEDHPAYWVTWVGAAVMAAWSGARLPTRAEYLEVVTGRRAVNASYKVGDASCVAEAGKETHSIHHAVGNLQVWCSDGPEDGPQMPVRRYLAGAAWNTPADQHSVSADRSRFLLGSSRGVGVRLVREQRSSNADEIGAWELAERLRRWVSCIDNQEQYTPGEADRLLLEVLNS